MFVRKRWEGACDFVLMNKMQHEYEKSTRTMTFDEDLDK